MIFNLARLQKNWKINPIGVLHVGAHLAEEAKIYEHLSWKPVTWIEAQPKLANELRLRLDLSNNKVIEATVFDLNGIKLKLKLTTNSQSTSVLELGTHASDYPDILVSNEIEVVSSRLDSILGLNDPIEFLNLDIQGVEDKALVGLGDLIENVNYIYTEVNSRDVYLGCAKVNDLDRFLSSLGFRRVATRWVLLKGWGDALYVRKSHIPFLSRFSLTFRFQQFIYYSKQTLLLLRGKIRKYG